MAKYHENLRKLLRVGYSMKEANTLAKKLTDKEKELEKERERERIEEKLKGYGIIKRSKN